MRYFRVKSEYDNMQVLCNGRYRGILIGRELYTEKEFLREFPSGTEFRGYGYVIKPDISGNLPGIFDQVDIRKNDTYWCFGARFRYGDKFPAMEGGQNVV